MLLGCREIIETSFVYPERQPGKKNGGSSSHGSQWMAGCCQHIRSHGFCNKILASANRDRHFLGRRTAVASDFGNDQSTVLKKSGVALYIATR
jgi:hypothetical protein